MKRILHYSRVFLILSAALWLNACQNDNPVEQPSTSNDGSPNATQLRKSAADLAKVLAVDLNTNESHRKEVFSKMANRFDGDRDMLLSHLADASIAEVQQLAKSSSLKSKLAKGGASYQEVDMQSLTMKYPKLQIMMPFLEQWTDAKIEQAGGLIVAYYPFGEDDRKVKEITGYDKNGNEVKITKETAPKIPYVILNLNERTNEMGYLQWDTKEQSLQGVDPKYFPVSQRGDWQTVKLTELQTKKLPVEIKFSNSPEKFSTSPEKPINLLEKYSNSSGKIFFKTLKSESALASYSEGGDPPPITYYTWVADYLKIDNNYDSWLESDIEPYIWVWSNNGPWTRGGTFVLSDYGINPNEQLIPEGYRNLYTFQQGANTAMWIEVWEEDDGPDDVIMDQHSDLFLYSSGNYDYSSFVASFSDIGLTWPVINGIYYTFSNVRIEDQNTDGRYLKIHLQ